jgi:RNA polymerase sigma-54 factor
MAMQLRQNLNLRMEQKLKLTPQMIQSIEILLLPQMALEERIMHEVESNPALEILDGPQDDLPTIERPDDAPRAEVPATAGEYGERGRGDSDFGSDDSASYGEYLKLQRSAPRGDDEPDKMEAIAAAAERPPCLADHLMDQLRFADLSDEERECAHDIAWQLDRRGYLTVRLDELFPEERLEAAEAAWEAVRQCEPIGVGARDLADCLAMQLEREPGDNSFELMLIRTHLHDMLRNRLPVVAQAVEVEVQRVQEALEVIAQLDPQPGLPFGRSENRVVIPDVVAECDELTGEWIVSVPDSHLPKITVSEEYQELLNDPAIERREKEYLREKLSGAKFIIDAVAQRKRTLLRIVTEVVKHQREFLEQGPEALRPLMRQDIAQIIGMHVATVSRAVKDKYIQTPGGVLRLSDFFSGGIASSDGGDAESSKSVRLRIHKLIEEEDKKHPLSDQVIADILAKDGLDISRRTVTKYRIADGIPSTRQRRLFA